MAGRSVGAEVTGRSGGATETREWGRGMVEETPGSRRCRRWGKEEDAPREVEEDTAGEDATDRSTRGGRVAVAERRGIEWSARGEGRGRG
jgi:hypothetical protein